MTETTKTASDLILATEAKELLYAYIEKANELQGRKMIVSFGITNGADGKPVSLNSFEVTKVIDKYTAEPKQQ